MLQPSNIGGIARLLLIILGEGEGPGHRRLVHASDHPLDLRVVARHNFAMYAADLDLRLIGDGLKLAGEGRFEGGIFGEDLGEGTLVAGRVALEAGQVGLLVVVAYRCTLALMIGSAFSPFAASWLFAGCGIFPASAFAAAAWYSV